MSKTLALRVCAYLVPVTIAIGMISTPMLAQDYPEDTTSVGPQPTYPGIPPSKGKMEGTLGFPVACSGPVGSYCRKPVGVASATASRSDTQDRQHHSPAPGRSAAS